MKVRVGNIEIKAWKFRLICYFFVFLVMHFYFSIYTILTTINRDPKIASTTNGVLLFVLILSLCVGVAFGATVEIIGLIKKKKKEHNKGCVND